MWKNKNYSMKLRVELQNGIYLFNDRSLGKSYFAKLLKEYRVHGCNALAYTYDDFCNGIDLLDCVRNTDRLILLDRYDLYEGHWLEDLVLLADSYIILIDWKNFTSASESVLLKFSLVNLVVKESGITVSLDKRFVRNYFA